MFVLRFDFKYTSSYYVKRLVLPLLLKIFTVSCSVTKYQHDLKKDFDMCPPKTFCLVWQLKSINKVTCSGRLSLSDAGSAGVFWL